MRFLRDPGHATWCARAQGRASDRKGKTVLVLNGKLSKSDLEQISLSDIAPKWRMACQYMILDEDILVEF